MRFLDRNTAPDDTPIKWLQTRLADATQLFAFVGFFDRAGGGLVEQELRAVLNRGGQIHVVVNRNPDGLPRYADTLWLLELLAPYGERASMRLVIGGAELNSKVYLVRDADGNRHALVGSANFTAAGLTRNFESCLAFGPDNPELLDEVEAAVSAWLRHRAAVAVDLGTARLMRLDGGNSPGSAEPITYLLQPWLDQVDAAGADRGLHTTADKTEADSKDAEAATVLAKRVFIPTGFTDLDRLLGGGWRAGNLVVVASRAGVGKSTLGLNFVRAAAFKERIPALVMTFATTRIEVINRVMSAEARVPGHVFRAGMLSEDDWTKLARRLGEIDEAPLLVNDSCTPTLRNVAAEIRRAVAEFGVELVVVDPNATNLVGRPVLWLV